MDNLPVFNQHLILLNSTGLGGHLPPVPPETFFIVTGDGDFFVTGDGDNYIYEV